MQSSYTLYSSEIPVKGIGYLVLHDPGALQEGVRALRDRGATYIFARGPLKEGEQDGFSITHVHDMLVMERTLLGYPIPERRLRLTPLTEQEAPVYIHLHNESFFHVPNGATIDCSELDKLLCPKEWAGLAWLERALPVVA